MKHDVIQAVLQLEGVCFQCGEVIKWFSYISKEGNRGIKKICHEI